MNTCKPAAPDWRAIAEAIELPHLGLVGGDWKKARLGASFSPINPATDSVLTAVTAFDAEDVNEAVKSARAAFIGSGWATAAPQERKQSLLRLAELIVANGPSLALMDSLAMGKPAQVALESDVPGAAAFIRWFAEASDKLYDEVVPATPGALVTATREPLGVIALITPWNYPLEEAAVKLAPALAAGNSVLLKPSELAPYSALRLGELAIEAGIPPGVLNVLPGLGATAGAALGRHGDVDCVAFTGSTAVGKLLLRYSGESNLKRIWLECGGKNPTIVFADWPDLDRAAAEAARSVFRNSGQVCSAGSRVLVERSILPEFLERLVAAAALYAPGDPLDPESRAGPMASRSQLQKTLDYIDIGCSEGARLVLDGRERVGTTGCFIDPSIFTSVRPEMRIAQEEIFGPVIAVTPFSNEVEAVAIANGTDYGLTASIWTADAARGLRLARQIAAGSVTINGMDSQSEAAPFGGYKQSGIGHEHSLHAFRQYTNLKTTWLHL